MDRFIIKKASFIDAQQGDIRESYQFGKKLGDGSYGFVYIANHITTNQTRAVKQIPKYKIRNPERLETEVGIMKQCDHPNIVRLYETWEDTRNVYLVQELCEGGELFDFIIKKRRLTEREAAGLFRQLLQSLSYLHSNNIVHRDLKPENLLFAGVAGETPLKLVDFGLAKMFQANDAVRVMHTNAGTPFYISPEILSGTGYNHKCDAWSAGVILYILLCGYPPFYGQSDAAILDRVKNCNYSFSRPEWRNVSAEAKDLISKLLVLDVNERLDIDQALSHAWVQENYEGPDVELNLDFESLIQFSTSNKLRKAVLMCVASQCSDKDIRNLRENFIALDTNGDGTLTLAELEQGLSQLPGVDMNQIQEIMNGMDVDKSGSVDYTEFLAATLGRNLYMQEERLHSAFKTFDKDGSGKISIDELRQVIGSENVPAEEVEELIREVDTNNDGEIDFNEFLKLMESKNSITN